MSHLDIGVMSCLYTKHIIRVCPFPRTLSVRCQWRDMKQWEVQQGWMDSMVPSTPLPSQGSTLLWMRTQALLCMRRPLPLSLLVTPVTWMTGEWCTSGLAVGVSSYPCSPPQHPPLLLTLNGPSAPLTPITPRFSGDPQLENHNVNELLRPSFNITFQNQGFRDNSAFSSRDNSTFMPQATSEAWVTDDQPGRSVMVVCAFFQWQVCCYE